MTMTNRRPRPRTREWLGALFVVALAVAAGVTAGRLGTHRAWEQPVRGTTTSIVDAEAHS
jgi:hypothetical protein